MRGPQDQVLQKWWDRRAARDLVIKLNTGGGKTTVGLLIAQSSLAEQEGPTAYLMPDHYLVAQVTAEARQLGIAVTTDPDDMDYARGRAILVDVFQKLFNGMSVFGVDGSVGHPGRVPGPTTLVIDDGHACLAKAEDAFRLTVPRHDEPADGVVLGVNLRHVPTVSPSPQIRADPRQQACGPGGVAGLVRARGAEGYARQARRARVADRLRA